MDIEDMKDQQLDEETLNNDDPISAAFTRIISSQLASMQEGLEAIGKAISGALEKIYTNIASIGDAFTKAIAQIEDNTRIAVSNLAEKGWYCDLGKTRTQFFEFLSNIVTDDDEISEENIIKYYRENLDQIKANLIALYPHRKKFIEHGFQSHNNSDFISSVPIFLMFTDGISFEKIEFSIFSSNNKQLKIKTGYANNLDINEIQRATWLFAVCSG
jgi:hypothetical protein